MTSVALAAALWLACGAVGCSRASPGEERAAAPGQTSADDQGGTQAEAGASEATESTAERAPSAGTEASDEAGQAERVEPEPPPRLPADFLAFDGACLPGDRVRLAFGGDLLLHHENQAAV